MAKFVHDDIMDTGLNVVKTNATTLILCSAQPATRAEAISYGLASTSVTSTDFTLGDGTTGRKLTCASKERVAVTAEGDGNFLAVIDGTRLLWVTTSDGQHVKVGNKVDFPEWSDTIADPT